MVDGDLVAARETFGGCLDRDALLTQYTWRDATHLVELHLPGASLRQVVHRLVARRRRAATGAAAGAAGADAMRGMPFVGRWSASGAEPSDGAHGLRQLREARAAGVAGAGRDALALAARPD